MHLLEKFGINEIYFHPGLNDDLLEKLSRRSEYTLDGEDAIILKHTSHDILFIFYREVPTAGIIYRFLKALDQEKNKDSFIQDNTLLNESELFSAIKDKSYVLTTCKTLVEQLK